eukprot:7568354-Alexandrium_andersonii.AAC.1
MVVQGWSARPVRASMAHRVGPRRWPSLVPAFLGRHSWPARVRRAHIPKNTRVGVSAETALWYWRPHA